MLASETGMAMASWGAWPAFLWRLLLVPAYLAHTVLGPLLRHDGRAILVVVIAASLGIDVALRRLSRRQKED
jgi:hypothetical protein